MIGIRRLAIAVAAWGSLAAAQPTAQHDPEVFSLVTSSQYCAVVTVLAGTSVGRRLSQKELETLTDLADTLGGTRYRLRVDEFLCGSTDVSSQDPGSSTQRPEGIDIFKKRDTSFFQGTTYSEGERYLVFAQLLPDQRALTAEYQLDPDRLYYREVDGGLFQLSDNDSSVLRMTRAFCEAVRPSDPVEKLKRLRLILLSKHLDEDFKESVLKAIAVIERK